MDLEFWKAGLTHVVLSVGVLMLVYALGEALGPMIASLFLPTHSG